MAKLLVIVVVLLAALIGLYFLAVPSTPRADFVFVNGDEHVTLDPQKISWVSDGRVAQGLYETLAVYQLPSLELEPGAAASWSVSDDQLTYTFTLRQDGKWSNGDPVTADDFVYAWRRAMLPDTAADYTKLMYTIKGAKDFYNWRAQALTDHAAASHDDAQAAADQLWEETLNRFDETVALIAVDDRTLEVTLERPTPYFLELCAFVTFSPVHRASHEARSRIDAASGRVVEDTTYWNQPEELVTNGAYTLAERTFKQGLRLEANPEYHAADQVKSKTIAERIIPTPQTALLAFDNGEVDWVPSLPSSGSLVSDLAKSERDDVNQVPMAGVYFYNFNCNPRLNDGRDNPLADPRVRRAFSMAVDRQTIVDQVTRLGQPVTKTYVPGDAVAGYDPPEQAGISHDVEAARALLAEAGYPGGNGLDGLSILYNTGSGHEDIAQAIARIWQQTLGVTITLEGVEVKTFSDRLKSHDYTIARASWFGDYRDPTTWLEKMRTGDGNNDCGYSNPEYDALLDRAAATLDQDERFAILRDAEAVLLRDSPMLMLYQYVLIHLADPAKVSGLHLNGWNHTRLEQIEVAE